MLVKVANGICAPVLWSDDTYEARSARVNTLRYDETIGNCADEIPMLFIE